MDQDDQVKVSNSNSDENFFKGIGYIYLILVQLGFLGVLYVIRDVSNFSDFFIIILAFSISWIVFNYLDGKRRMWRHAILMHVTYEDSYFRKIFWESIFSKIFHAIISLVSAFAVIIIIARIQMHEWWMLTASIMTFSIIFYMFERIFKKQILPLYITYVSLTFAYWVNLIVIVIASSLYSLYFVDFVDTRSMTLTEVLHASYSHGSGLSDSRYISVLLGIDSAVREASMHLMQIASSQVNVSSTYKLLAWLCFFIFMALQYGFLWLAIIGISTLTIKANIYGISSLAETSVLKPAMMTLAFLSLISITGYQLSQQFSWDMGSSNTVVRSNLHSTQTIGYSSRPVNVEQANDTALVVKCVPEEFNRQISSLENLAFNKRSDLRANFEKEFELYLFETKNKWMQHTELGVDVFLDWNFSSFGYLSSLFHWAIQNVPGEPLQNYYVNRLREQLGIPETQVHNNLRDLIEYTLNESMPINFNEEISDIDEHLNSSLHGFLMMTNNSLEEILKEGYLIDPSCLDDMFPNIDLTRHFRSNYHGIGSLGVAALIPAHASIARRTLGAGRVGVPVAKFTKDSVVNRTSARIASKLGLKLSSKLLTNAASSTTGGICGPFVAVCAVGIFIASEVAYNRVDELLNRNDMKVEMMQDFEVEIDSILHEVRQIVLSDLNDAFQIQEQYEVSIFNAYRNSVSVSN